ncbi:MAG: hypothetical protein JXO22_07075, partial [Phycisphaerae bacterium]|nr:hypothetical protein [Phycisphaerae bacterium]
MMNRAHITVVLSLIALTCVGCVNPLAEREYWTIRCVSITGPDQYRVANFLADSLKQVDRIKPDLVK